MGKARRSLYKAARILGDIEAVSKGRAGKRIQRRAAGKMTGKALKGSGCFIATACYGSSMADEVQLLEQFRDKYLVTNIPGILFVDAYYTVSPLCAEFITRHHFLRTIVKAGLKPIVKVCSFTRY
jgi:hypothetical protein